MLRALEVRQQGEDHADEAADAGRAVARGDRCGLTRQPARDEAGRGPVPASDELDAGIVADLLHEACVMAGRGGALVLEDRLEERPNQSARGDPTLGLQLGEGLEPPGLEDALAGVDDRADESFARSEVVADRSAVALTGRRHHLAERYG